MVDEQSPRRPGRRNPLLLPVRALMHWIIKFIVLAALGIRRALRPKPTRYGLVALVLVGILAWRLLGNMAVGQPITDATRTSSTMPVSTVASNLLPPSPTVESYLKAQANFDAQGMWNSIGSELKQQMQAQNITAQQLQQELDSARQQGRRYRAASYVGGTPMIQGGAVYFYVLTVDTPSGTADVPYIYVVGQDGKIVSIQ